MSNTSDLKLEQIDFKWVENETSAKRLKKALRMLQDDGGFQQDLMDALKLRIESIQPTKMMGTVEKQEKLDDLKGWIKDLNYYEKTATIDYKALSEKERYKGNDYVKSSDFTEAVAHQRKAVEYNPSCHLAYANLGLAQMRLKNYTQAVESLDEALKLEPGYLKAVARRAECYYTLENWQDAVEDQEKCLESEPNNKDFIEKLKKSREKLLTSRDFQKNERSRMKKVQIEEDSSEGEDVDFGDDKKEEAKKEANPGTKVSSGMNHDTSKPSPAKKTVESMNTSSNDHIEKMTEDEPKQADISKQAKSDYKQTSATDTVDPEQEKKRLAAQEQRIKDFVKQYSTQDSTSSLNIVAIREPTSELRVSFDKLQTSQNDQKNKCTNVLKSGDYTKVINDFKVLLRSINAENIDVEEKLTDFKNQFTLKIYGNLSLAFQKTADYKNCINQISKALNNYDQPLQLYEDREFLKEMMEDSLKLRIKLYARASQTYEAMEQQSKALSILKKMRDNNLLFDKMHADIRRLSKFVEKETDQDDFKIYKHRKNIQEWVNLGTAINDIASATLKMNDMDSHGNTTKHHNELKDTHAVEHTPKEENKPAKATAVEEPKSPEKPNELKEKPYPQPKKQVSLMTLPEKLEQSKEVGNQWQTKDDFDECVMAQGSFVLEGEQVCTGKAANSPQNNDPEQIARVSLLLSQIYSNLSLLQLNQSLINDCINQCKKSIERNKDNPKALQRLAIAQEHVNDFVSAEMNLKKVLALEPKNKTAHNKYEAICAIIKSQISLKSRKNNLKSKNKKISFDEDQGNEEFIFKANEIVTEQEVNNPKPKLDSSLKVIEETKPKSKVDDIMEEDKVEEKIAESSNAKDSASKFAKLDNSKTEIKTKQRVRTKEDVKNDDKNDDKSNTMEAKEKSKGKIKITKLTKKSKPTNVISLVTGINACKSEWKQGWDFLLLCTAEELGSIIENKDLEVEVIVSIFSIFKNCATPADQEFCASLVTSITKTKSQGLQKMMLSKSDKAIIGEFLQKLKSAGIYLDEEEKILI